MKTRSPLKLGQFELDRLLKRGGMSEVWLGCWPPQSLPVAVKFLKPVGDEQRQGLGLEAAFQREVRAIASLDHPYIVSVIDWGTITDAELVANIDGVALGSPYLVMEYAAGGSLHELEHELSWPQIRAILLKLLEALAHAHAREVIHRDLKPGNVLLRLGKGSVEDILLSDFGLAYELERTLDEQVQHVLGTPSYMAPEQITNDWREQGPWTDLYALGCMAWSLLHGQPPFVGERTLHDHLHTNLPRYAPRVPAPDRLKGWLRTLLAKNPRDRFRFAAEAARELLRMDSLSASQPVLRGWGERARPQTPLQRLGQGLGLVEIRPSPLIGRTQERQLMQARFDEVLQSRRPHVLLLEGKPGVGKSRLAQWLTHRSAELGLSTTLHGVHGREHRDGQALANMLNHYLRCAALDREATHARVKRAVRRLAKREDSQALIDQDITLLTALMTQQEVFERSPAETYDAMARQLARTANYRPMIIWMDDLEYGERSLRFLLHYMEQAPRAPLLFVLTLDETPQAQSEQVRGLLELLRDLPSTTTLRVDRLDALSHAALIQNLLPLSASLAREVERLSDGNPLFTICLVNELVQRDALLKQDQGWSLKPGLCIELPDEITQLFSARQARLLERFGDTSARARDALEIAACLGTELLFDEWYAACDQAQLVIPEGLIEQALMYRLAQWTEVGWCFDHVMVRESLLLTARHQGRAPAHHAACAKMLLEHYGIEHTHVAERLSHHLIEAQQPQEALSSLLVAMEFRRIQGDFVQGSALYKQWSHWMQALAFHEDDARWSLGELTHARLLLTQGELDGAKLLIASALARAQRAPDEATVAEALLLRGWLLRKTGALELTRQDLEQAMLRFESLGLRDGLGRCLVAIGELDVTLGEYQRAMQSLSSSVELLEQRNNYHELGRALMVLSELAYGQLDEYHGDIYIERAIAQFQREGNRVSLAQAYNFQGEVARRRGELERATAHYRRALAMMRTTTSRELIIPCLNLLFTMLERHEYQAAQQFIPSVWREMERVGWRSYESCLRLGKLCCQGAQEHWQEWPQELELITTLLEEAGLIDVDVALLAEHAAQLALRAGHTALGARALSLALLQRRRLQQDELALALEQQLSALSVP